DAAVEVGHGLGGCAGAAGAEAEPPAGEPEAPGAPPGLADAPGAFGCTAPCAAAGVAPCCGASSGFGSATGVSAFVRRKSITSARCLSLVMPAKDMRVPG